MRGVRTQRHDYRQSMDAMVQRLLGFFFGSASVLLLLYAIIRLTQPGEGALSPVRRTMMLGGVCGMLALLGLLAWWAWVAPPE